jgi:hypothetical protein
MYYWYKYTRSKLPQHTLDCFVFTPEYMKENFGDAYEYIGKSNGRVVLGWLLSFKNKKNIKFKKGVGVCVGVSIHLHSPNFSYPSPPPHLNTINFPSHC